VTDIDGQAGHATGSSIATGCIIAFGDAVYKTDANDADEMKQQVDSKDDAL